MSVGATSRLRRTLGEYGFTNTLLLALQRVLQTFSPAAVIDRLYIVSQPVPPPAPGSARRSTRIEIRRLGPNDPALAAFTRIPAEIADRFAQNAVCLGAFRGEELLGWLWFVPGSFSDFMQPVRFELHPAGKTAWDFDVYVRPDARLSGTFSRLWEAAFEALREHGVTRSLSAISAYNPASISAHRRLGTAPFGSIMVIRLGRFQAVFSRRFKPRLQWSCQPGFRATLQIEAPRPGS